MTTRLKDRLQQLLCERDADIFGDSLDPASLLTQYEGLLRRQVIHNPADAWGLLAAVLNDYSSESAATLSRLVKFKLARYKVDTLLGAVPHTADNRYLAATLLLLAGKESILTGFGASKSPVTENVLGQLLQKEIQLRTDTSVQSQVAQLLFGDAWYTLYGDDLATPQAVCQHVWLERPPFAKTPTLTGPVSPELPTDITH